MKAQAATLIGSVVGGVLASVCCIGPLVFALLGAASYITYGPATGECGPGAACEMPRANRAGKLTLWIAAVVVVLTSAFPLYSAYLF